MNIFTFTGNLGRDAETRFTQSGDPITSFSVAVKSGYGKSESTSWINCNYWGKRGEAVAPHLKKGAQVAVSGEFSLRTYTTKGGEEKTSPDVNVRELTLLGSRHQAEPATPATDKVKAELAAGGSGFDDFEDSPF